MPKRSSGSDSEGYDSDSNSNQKQQQQQQKQQQQIKPYKKPSTRTRKIPKSCAVCHFRKVRCDQLVPACSACRRHAKTLGQDPDAVKCEYATTSAVRINRSLSAAVEDSDTGSILSSSGVTGVGVESSSTSNLRISTPPAPIIHKPRPKRKNRRRVIVDRTTSESDEQELEDYNNDEGTFDMEGMGTGQDFRRAVVASSSNSNSSTRGFSSASLARATPPPPLSLPPLPPLLLIPDSRESSPLSDIKRSPSPSTEENPIFYPPIYSAVSVGGGGGGGGAFSPPVLPSEYQNSEVASPTSTSFENPLPTPKNELPEFHFPPTSDSEVVQQDYDSLEFGFPENISPGGRSRSGTIMFTPSLSGLTTGDGSIPLWAT